VNWPNLRQSADEENYSFKLEISLVLGPIHTLC
jgi:hypothetical protein